MGIFYNLLRFLLVNILLLLIVCCLLVLLLKMNNDKLKLICIQNHTCYYFDDINNTNDLDLDSISIIKKTYENILIYYGVYKILYGGKPLCIVFSKVDWYIREYDKTRSLALFYFNKKYQECLEKSDVLLWYEAKFQAFIPINIRKSKLTPN